MHRQALDYVDVPEIAEMMRETKHCLACGKRLKRGHGFKVKQGYCTAHCYYEKPPKMAWVERVYNKPARVAIVDVLNGTSSVDTACDLLGISKYTIYQWMQKLDIKRTVRYE